MLRPWGYLAIGLVWLALWAVVVALTWSLPVYAMIRGDMTLGDLAQNQSTSSWIVAGILVLPILAVIWGPVLTWYLPCATWPLAVLSFLYAVRALSPAYSAERLSHSEVVPPGTTLGPPTLFGTSLSLQPVRRNRFTDLLMAFYMSGWNIDGRAGLAAIPSGVAFILVVPALAIDVPMGVRAVCGAAAAALWIWSAVWIARTFYRRFWGSTAGSAGI
ncbi:hypothetical protein [Promicromonospora aerolata]|uniref:Uncharacterized protein n=1 Tax=Promicromonospora aerolata TaxID=195749 RepID=A0ABW4V782_9MICO